MSSSDFMPLHGALLISNPRSNPMSRVFDNPNWYRSVHLAAGSAERQQRRNYLRGLRAEMRQQGGADWSANAGLRSAYEAAAAAKGYVTGKELTSALKKGQHPKTGSKLQQKTSPKARRAAQKVFAFDLSKIPGRVHGGAVKTWSKTKGGAFRWGKKRMVNARGQVVANVENIRKYNVARGARRAASGFDPAVGWQPGQVKAMRRLIDSGFSPALLPGEKLVYSKAERKSKAKKAATTRGRNIKAGKSAPLFGGKGFKFTKEGAAQVKALMASGLDRKAATRQAYAKKNGLALSNPGVFGGLALDNYGGLALDNGLLPFGLGVVAVDTAKVIGTGLAGAALHAVISPKIEEYLPKVPMIGERLLALEVPESIPVFGGMGLSNTITGIIGGLAVIVGSQFLGRKLGINEITTYGSALGGGILIAGPVLDFAGKGGSDKAGLSADDLAGLALDNYGGLSEDQYSGVGVFGDGMAYELGPIAGDTEYGQASLGDAYYSGADFDMDEGASIVQGRGRFQSRFGSPAQRIDAHGGREGGAASHLAGQPGHRWGWLIKTIGWKNVELLARMQPAARVRALKQLRESAMATFRQISQQSRVEALAPNEFAPVVSGAVAGGADGVHGASSSFGSTIFGGQGL